MGMLAYFRQIGWLSDDYSTIIGARLLYIRTNIVANNTVEDRLCDLKYAISSKFISSWDNITDITVKDVTDDAFYDMRSELHVGIMHIGGRYRAVHHNATTMAVPVISGNHYYGLGIDTFKSMPKFLFRLNPNASKTIIEKSEKLLILNIDGTYRFELAENCLDDEFVNCTIKQAKSTRVLDRTNHVIIEQFRDYYIRMIKSGISIDGHSLISSGGVYSNIGRTVLSDLLMSSNIFKYATTNMGAYSLYMTNQKGAFVLPEYCTDVSVSKSNLSVLAFKKSLNNVDISDSTIEQLQFTDSIISCDITGSKIGLFVPPTEAYFIGIKESLINNESLALCANRFSFGDEVKMPNLKYLSFYGFIGEPDTKHLSCSPGFYVRLKDALNLRYLRFESFLGRGRGLELTVENKGFLEISMETCKVAPYIDFSIIKDGKLSKNNRKVLFITKRSSQSFSYLFMDTSQAPQFCIVCLDTDKGTMELFHPGGAKLMTYIENIISKRQLSKTAMAVIDNFGGVAGLRSLYR